jgi:putative PIN family toxin of toxin-antitoxin system
MRPDADLVRAVVDVNVLISAVLSARGQPAEILRSHRNGEFELIVSELLIDELARALAYPEIRKRIPAEQAAAFIGWLRDHGTFAEDPADRPPVRSPDPGDDHLLALAISLRAFLVTGDQHLLGLRDDLPILTPAEFVSKLEQAG